MVLARKTDNTLYVWGRNQNGELGNGTTSASYTGGPNQLGTDDNWDELSAGGQFCIATKTNGTLYGWGLNAENQLGLGDIVTRLTPTQIGTATNWTGLGINNGGHSFAFNDNGEVFVWGSNTPSGQTGVPSGATVSVPTLLDAFTVQSDLTITQSPLPGTVVNEGASQTVTITATTTEATGSCNFTVTVEDNQTPTFTNCPATYTANLVGGTVTVALADLGVTATDNCTATTAIEAGNSTVTYGCNDIGTGAGTIVVTLTDGTNTATPCTIGIDVTDDNNTCCGINITSATPTVENCPGAGDGSITVVATGATNLEYSLDGTTWQSGNVFEDLDDDTYNVMVRDADNNSCTDSESVVVAAGTDTEAPVFSAAGSGDILYTQAFDNPNVMPFEDLSACWDDLSHNQGVNTLWSTPGFMFQQPYTCETILINGPKNTYADPSNIGGDYCVAMYDRSSADDALALLFDVQGENFLNVRMDVSGITIMGGCPNLGTLAEQTFQVTVYDNPGGGSFDFANPGTTLSQQSATVPARPGIAANTFSWAEVTAGLDVSASQDGNVVLEWDLIGGQYAYAALDNIVISANEVSVSQECPDNVTIEAASPTGTVYNYTAPIAGDNCGANTIQTTGFASGATFPISVTTNTFVATDGGNNTATCTFTVTVQDTEAPVAPTLAELTVECSVTPTAPTAEDAVAGTVTGTTSTTFPITSSTTITWTFTDGTNAATADQVVTIMDTQAPTFDNCPATYTANLGPGATVTITLADLGLTVSDNCNSSITPTFSASSELTFDCDDLGANAGAVTVEASDGTNDAIPCVITVNVTDMDSECYSCDIVFSDGADPNPPAIVTGRVVCGDDGSIIVNANCNGCANGNADLRYSIDGVIFQAGNSFSNLPAGDYTVTVRDVDNTDCFVTTTATVGECVGELPGNNIDDDCDSETDEASSVAWVLLDGSDANANCTSTTDLCGQQFCYGLEFTPGVSGTLTSYTTGFLTDCVDGATSILSNASCVMTDNSLNAEDCANNNGVFFNASGNSGGAAMVELTKDVPLILHQVCLTVPDNTTLTLTEDEVTDITMSITVAPVLSTDEPILVTDFPDYDETTSTAAGNYDPVVTAGTIDGCYDDVASAETAALAATTFSDDFTANGDLIVTAGTTGTCDAVVTVTVEGKFQRSATG